MEQHYRERYEIFLHNFRMQHGYLPAPSFEEWKYNVIQHTAVNNFVPVYSVPVCVRSISSCVPVYASTAGVSTSMTTPSFSLNNTTVPYRTTTSLKDANKPNLRTMWTEVEQEVLVNSWKDQFEELETVRKTEAWAKILSAVCTVGQKTLKQCKDKIKNLRELYKEAKDKNKQTGESLHKSPHFNIFDEVLGTRHVIRTPFLREVGVKNDTNVAATPTRAEVESLLKSGRKRKASLDKSADMKMFFLESEERNQKFLSELLKNQIEEEKAEREKDRELLWKLFTSDKK